MKTDSLSSDELRELFVNVDGLSLPVKKENILAGPLSFEVTKWTEKEKEEARESIKKDWPDYEVIDMGQTRASANVLSGLAIVPIEMEDMSDITFWLIRDLNVATNEVKIHLSIFNKYFCEVEHLLVVPEELAPLVGIASLMVKKKLVDEKPEEV